MDIHKEWQELNDKLFSNQSLKNEEIMNAITSESSSAIHKLKKGMINKTYWCLLFITGFTIWMFFSRDNIEAMIAIGIVNLIYIVGFFMIRREAKRMDAALKKEQNVLGSMKRNLKLMNRAISLEKNIFVLGTPLIVLCSMFYNGFKNGDSFEFLIQDARFLKYAIIYCILAVPFVYFFGAYLNNKSFGPHIEQLTENINKLEGVEFLKTI